MKKLFIAIALAVFVVIVTPLAIGYYLSPRDELKQADVIVVVSGGELKERVKEGVWLYNSDYAKKIIFSGAAREGDVSNALQMKRYAIADGVPAEDIFMEEESVNTMENAEFTSPIIEKEGYESIILTTSPYHQRRAYKNFREYLGKDFEIINWSAKDSKWRKYGWWRNVEGIRLTFSEMAKIMYSSAKDNKEQADN